MSYYGFVVTDSGRELIQDDCFTLSPSACLCFLCTRCIPVCQLLTVHGEKKTALQISFNVQFNCQLKDALSKPLEMCHLL